MTRCKGYGGSDSTGERGVKPPAVVPERLAFVKSYCGQRTSRHAGHHVRCCILLGWPSYATAGPSFDTLAADIITVPNTAAVQGPTPLVWAGAGCTVCLLGQCRRFTATCTRIVSAGPAVAKVQPWMQQAMQLEHSQHQQETRPVDYCVICSRNI